MSAEKLSCSDKVPPHDQLLLFAYQLDTKDLCIGWSSLLVILLVLLPRRNQGCKMLKTVQF